MHQLFLLLVFSVCRRVCMVFYRPKPQSFGISGLLGLMQLCQDTNVDSIIFNFSGKNISDLSYVLPVTLEEHCSRTRKGHRRRDTDKTSLGEEKILIET